MKDLEEVEFTGAQSNWGYVRATMESWRMVAWMWRELTTDLGRRKLKQMVVWAILRNIVWLSVTYFIALAATAATREEWEVAYLNGRYLIGALALAALFRLVQDRCTEWSLGETIIQVDYALNRRFFDKSLSQHRSKGNMLDAANVEKGRGRAWEMMVTLLWQGTEAIVQLSVACVFLLLIAPLAWAVMMVMLVLFLGSMVVINREVLRIGTKLDKDFRAMNRRRADLWEHARLVIWADAVDREVEALHTWSKKLIGHDRALWFPYLMKADVRALLVLLVVGVLFNAGIGWVQGGSLLAKELVPLGVWCMQIAAALEQLRNLDRIINWNGPAIRAMRDDLEIPNDVPEHPQAVPVPEGPVGIRLDDVFFHYDDGDPVLKGISLDLAPGERVAIVGKSGSGKTTLMRLIRREMDVIAGEISISRHHLPRLQRKSWRRAAGYIPQQPDPLNDTLRANLVFGLSVDAASGWSDEELWQMLESVELGSRKRFKAGLDTLIGKRGLDLSGGEQQRLMIARALVKKPRVLLVDEATSSLDAEMEEEVQHAIDTALGTDVTAVIIAHRLATIANVDRVVVLQDGRIIDQGTHVELFERCDLFRRLCVKQKISYARAS